MKSPGRSLSQHLDAAADKSGAEETTSSLSKRRKEKDKNPATMLSQGLRLGIMGGAVAGPVLCVQGARHEMRLCYHYYCYH